MLAIYRLPHNFFFWKCFIHKNLHIEPFNYAIKSVCFNFCSTNMDSSVIGTSRSEGSLLPSTGFDVITLYSPTFIKNKSAMENLKFNPLSNNL